MSKARFGAVKELIDEKKYAEARLLLKTINHPAARQLEDVIDELDPPSLSSFLKREPVSASERASYLRKLAVFFGIILFLGLAAYMLGVFSPHLTSIEIKQATDVAYNSARYATQTAVTPTLRPSSTPTPTIDQTEIARLRQTLDADNSNRTATEASYIEKADSSYATTQYLYTEAVVTRDARHTQIAINLNSVAKPTNTPLPPLAVTPMNTTIYYEIGKYGTFLKLCPRENCKHSQFATHRGEAVMVVGVVAGDTINSDGNSWYVIQVTDGGRTVYQYALTEELALNTPTPLPTNVPYVAPLISFTPRPTSTRHP